MENPVLRTLSDISADSGFWGSGPNFSFSPELKRYLLREF